MANRQTSWLGRLAEPVVELVFPDRCAQCDGPVQRPGLGWCDACRGALRWLGPGLCSACMQPVDGRGICRRCVEAGRPWTRMISAVRYEGEVQDLVARWKYQPEPPLSRPLASLLTQIDPAWVQRHGLVVPIPQGATSWHRRAFSPSVDIARAVGLPLRNAIRRRRNAPPQVGLTARQRRRNVRRLFEITPRAGVAGEHVLLVDDVVTTTATATAAASLLRDAGVASVGVASMARAPLSRL